MNREEKQTCNLDLSFEFDDRKQNNSLRKNDKCSYEEEQNDEEKVQFDLSFEIPETETSLYFAKRASLETLRSSKGKKKLQIVHSQSFFNYRPIFFSKICKQIHS